MQRIGVEWLTLLLDADIEVAPARKYAKTLTEQEFEPKDWKTIDTSDLAEMDIQENDWDKLVYYQRNGWEVK